MRPSALGAAAVMGIALLVGAGSPTAAAGSLAHRSERYGLEFQYPDTFAVGRYRRELSPEAEATMKAQGLDVPFANAIVLIERARLVAIRLDAIPIGEVATVTVEPWTGRRARFLNEQFNKKQFEISVGGRAVVRLPGYPGPYGDTAFYYLVPVAEDRAVELYAHRKYLDGARGDTHYDRMIEGIIAMLKFFKPNP